MRIALATLTLALFAMTASAAPSDCDRTCLTGFITQYLDAMLTHTPKTLPLSNNVRFTEDTVEMKLGEGLWKNASKIRAFRQDILDVRQGVAASLVIVEEAGMPAMLALRLKIADKKITEVETQVTRKQSEGALFAIDALQTPGPVMSSVPEKSQLMSREEATKLAMLYPAGLKIGNFVTVDAPFAADAYRIENGARTAGPGCARAGCENLKTQKIIEHPGIVAHVAAVDEELGIVLLRMNFGQTGSYGPGNALFVFEAFKVYGGQIHGVEAFMKILPANQAWLELMMKLPFLFLIAAAVALQAQTFPSPNTTHPTVIHKVDPEYTPEATQAKLQGAVTLTTTIAADGIPTEIKIVRGLGMGLDEKAVECLRKWRFKPATTNGEPIASKATVEINFRLLAPQR